MKSYSLLHLDDHVLLRDLATLVSQDRATTAVLLAHLAEVEERKLYARAAYSSMYLYCVRELRMSEDVAYARIRVARTARQFPAIFPALADGRLHLSAVVQLAPHLTAETTQETAEELLAAAANKTKTEIELLLAKRFPKPDVPTLVQAIAVQGPADELVPEPAGGLALQQVAESTVPSAMQLVPEPVLESPRARLTPLSPGRFALQGTMGQKMYEQLRYTQSLLGHALPTGDVMKVLERALDLAVEVLEKRKFAKCTRTRPRRSHANGRYVPAEIRRIVSKRDGGQCTFVSEKGKRCEARDRLEFDHMDPVARGGQTTADRMQLRCRAHNQYTAECAFGAGFMREKRQEARRAASARKQAHAQKQEQARSVAAAKARAQAAATATTDVIACLRELKFSAEEARRGAALCAHIPDASLEERVRVALRGLAPPSARRAAHAGS